jgi:nickel/cobalt transporter (NicO) family protein
VPVTAGASARSIRRFALAAIVALVTLAAAVALARVSAQVGPLDAMRQPAATGIVGWIVAKQSLFYREMSGLIRAAKTDGSALWGLMGVSFIYGIFHAAGPGHGKAVISSYLLANEETWRRGVTLSFASALLQSLTAVVLVAIAALVIGATAKMMGDTVRVIELVSYALIIALGSQLFWVKGRSFLNTLHAVRSASEAEPSTAAAATIDHIHHHRHDRNGQCRHHAHGQAYDDHGDRHGDHANHGHGHDHSDEEEDVLPWGHAHGPEPEELAGPGGWRRGLSAIVAVGLRPCSGAIIVLVFALAQGLFWTGVASTFVMGIGTAITVAAIATLAIGAKAAARRLAASRPGYGTLAQRSVEVGAATVIVLFGVLLLTGTMASERVGMF